MQDSTATPTPDATPSAKNKVQPVCPRCGYDGSTLADSIRELEQRFGRNITRNEYDAFVERYGFRYPKDAR